MTDKYYFDTCIWRDHYENRIGKTGRHLGKYATELFNKIMTKKDKILFSKLTYHELRQAHTNDEIKSMLHLLNSINILQRVEISKLQIYEAQKYQKKEKFMKAMFYTQFLQEIIMQS